MIEGRITSIKRYAFLLSTFRNGFDLIQNLRHGGQLAYQPPPMSKATFWDGTHILHHPTRGGLTGTILEIMHENTYGIGDFYTPRPGDVVFDVGAHVGVFTSWIARRYPDCQIIAVEASPENFKYLEQNVRHVKNVRLHHRAIGGRPGRFKVKTETDRSSDTYVIKAEAGDPDAVDVILMRDLLDFVPPSQRVALLKMDVEGGEYDVFETIEDATLARIERIAMEYHDNLKPGTLELVRERLHATHRTRILPDGNTKHGRLFAELRSL